MELRPIDILAPESKIKFLERIEDLFAGKEVRNEVDYKIVTKDGKEIWSRLCPTYIYRDQKLVGAHVIVFDISRFKEVEETARRITDRFTLFFENTQELIVVIQDGCIKYVNDIAMNVGGYEKDKLASIDFLEFVHPDDREEAVKRYLRRISGDDIRGTSQMRIRISDGSYRWAEVKSILIEWEGSPATLNFIADITEKVNFENDLKKVQDNYRLVVENTLEAIVIIKDGIVKFINVNKIGGFQLFAGVNPVFAGLQFNFCIYIAYRNGCSSKIVVPGTCEMKIGIDLTSNHVEITQNHH